MLTVSYVRLGGGVNIIAVPQLTLGDYINQKFIIGNYRYSSLYSMAIQFNNKTHIIFGSTMIMKLENESVDIFCKSESSVNLTILLMLLLR